MKYTGGGTVGRNCGDVIIPEIVISNTLVNSKSYILNLTSDINLLAVTVYVWYRSRYPDAATVQDVQNELQENNINATQLVDWPDKNCL